MPPSFSKHDSIDYHIATHTAHHFAPLNRSETRSTLWTKRAAMNGSV